MPVHEKIKQVRLLRGLTQADMAEKLDISENSYSNFERGKTCSNEEKLEKICQILGISLVDLFNLDSKSTVLNLIEHQKHCGVGNITNGCSFSECAIKAELETHKLLIEEKDKRIALLAEMNDLLKFRKSD